MSTMPRRTVDLQVGSFKVSDLHTEFQVHADLTKNPNKAQIVVYNASEATRASWSEAAHGVYVQLSAGYDGKNQLLFKGRLRLVTHQHDHADWISTIESGDGDSAVSHLSIGFGAGAYLSAAAKRVAEEAGLALGNIGSALGVGKLLTGHQVHGRSLDELDRLARMAGKTLSIQSETALALGDDECLPGQALVLDAGLIGFPQAVEVQQQGAKKKVRALKLTHLLVPDLVPGRQVVVDGQRFKVYSADYTGQIAGPDWKVELTCRALG